MPIITLNIDATGGGMYLFAMTKLAKGEVASRMRALRTRMKLSQENLADAAGIQREVVAKVETGVNLLHSHKLRLAFARGFHVSVDALGEYLEGKRDLASIVALSLDAQLSGLSTNHMLASPPTAPARADIGRAPRVRTPQKPPEDSDGRFEEIERAVGVAFDAARHRVSDATATMELVRQVGWPPARDGLGSTEPALPEIAFSAARWLDLAAWLRVRGLSVTAENALYVAIHRSETELRDDLLGPTQAR